MEAFPEILGRSQAMQRLFEAMARVAGHDVIVHIHGETGTGKEKVARALHAQSPRRGGPFVAVNAAGLSDDLFESQVFGHARGAFTGAVCRSSRARDGRRGRHPVPRRGGRAAASPAGQAAALPPGARVPAGGGDPSRRADVRLVTAANVDLHRRVPEAASARTCSSAWTSMRWRSRPCASAATTSGCWPATSSSARRGRPGGRGPTDRSTSGARVRGYHWPGNVRQLENEMRRLVLLGGAGALDPRAPLGTVAEGRPASRIPLRCAARRLRARLRDPHARVPRRRAHRDRRGPRHHAPGPAREDAPAGDPLRPANQRPGEWRSQRM